MCGSYRCRRAPPTSPALVRSPAMKISVLLRCLAWTALALPVAFAAIGQRSSKKPASSHRIGDPPHVAPDIAACLRKWNPLEMPSDAAKLSSRERQLVEKLV